MESYTFALSGTLGNGPDEAGAAVGVAAVVDPEVSVDIVAWPPLTVTFIVGEVPKFAVTLSHARTYKLWLPSLTGTETERFSEFGLP
jgi:hypothetical protein